MRNDSKQIRVSTFAAKLLIRLYILVLFAGLVPFFVKGSSLSLKNTFISLHSFWPLVFPALLFLGFLILLAICIVQRFRKPDYTWPLVVNTVMLLLYTILLYIRIYPLVF